MRIAIPLAEGKLCSHFGHCETFALVDVDEKNRKILARNDRVPPPHEPGVLPKWLSGQNTNVVIAGGMGPRAIELFTQNNVRVVLGASADTPEALVMCYLDGSLKDVGNACTHGEGHACEH